MRVNRVWIAISAGALLVASEAAAQQRTGGSGIPVTKDATVAPTTTPANSTTVVAGGDVTLPAFDLAVYANVMNEKHITAHMAAGDSLEIQLAELASHHATDPRIRGYANMLATDHRAHLAKTMEIITDEDVGAEPMANDPEGLRMRATLARLSNMTAGSSWDADFVRFQAEHHQHEIDLLTANIKNAHDDDLEEHIKKSLTSLAKHRDMAKSIATTLGIR